MSQLCDCTVGRPSRCETHSNPDNETIKENTPIVFVDTSKTSIEFAQNRGRDTKKQNQQISFLSRRQKHVCESSKSNRALEIVNTDFVSSDIASSQS